MTAYVIGLPVAENRTSLIRNGISEGARMFVHMQHERARRNKWIVKMHLKIIREAIYTSQQIIRVNRPTNSDNVFMWQHWPFGNANMAKMELPITPL